MSTLSRSARNMTMADAESSLNTPFGVPSELKGHHIRQMAIAVVAVSWAAILYAVV